MRIISQSGTISIEFDGCDLMQQENMIIADTPFRKNVVLGEYKDALAAGQIFMDIHNSYKDDCIGTYEMPLDE